MYDFQTHIIAIEKSYISYIFYLKFQRDTQQRILFFDSLISLSVFICNYMQLSPDIYNYLHKSRRNQHYFIE